ncbi:DUF2726 domain-containing protein [Glaciecola sp. XM2]|jgi:hypothetical protein|uniref:DUF2726 domain-containing protein n=1 Tax=Glaciecola sp. XM2 TaxID=1914931 RepID=UPI001BDE38A4|nr:DUF2726 domain-containing protein [Glaciecola sp. XM2]MBT1452497.1 DUF2726 domain-containing protein [Glaciecola sp. XM2]
MEIAILLLAVLICISVLAVKVNDNKVEFPFAVKKQLFTSAERQFLALIEQAAGDEFRVLCRVKLIDLLALRSNTDKKIANSALLRAGGKQVDFVLCDRKDMTPVMAIDLVYGQGKAGHNTQRDFFVSGALDTASIPHARIKAKNGYTLAEIKECIETKLIPLRRRQGKIPFNVVQDKPSIVSANKRPTRPLSPSRRVAA